MKAGMWFWNFYDASSLSNATIGARLLIRDLMCFVSGQSISRSSLALVGGNWNNTSRAGLWYWNLNEASSNAWTNIGARLLNLGLGVFECFCCRDDTRVGGAYWDNTNAGLWNWNVDNASSKANANIGARLIILVFGVY